MLLKNLGNFLEAMQQIAIIIKRELMIYYRDKSYVISSLARPLLWLVFLGFGLSGSFKIYLNYNYVQFIFPGILAMSIMFTSIFYAMSIIWDRQFGFLKVILVAPITRVAIVMAKTISGCILTIIQGLIILFCAFIFKIHLSFLNFLFTLFIMCLTALALTSMGIAISARMTSFEGFNVIMNFFLMPMFFLSGAMYPLSKVPKFLKIACALNPVTYAVDALRYSILGINTFPLALDLSLLTIFLLIMGTFSVWNFK